MGESPENLAAGLDLEPVAVGFTVRPVALATGGAQIPQPGLGSANVHGDARPPYHIQPVVTFAGGADDHFPILRVESVLLA